jgi:Tol biopolymer transport system component
MVSLRAGNAWSNPVPTSFSGEQNDAHPWLTPDGQRLFFISRRPCPGAKQALNVWVVQRTGEGWSDPESLGRPVTEQTVHAPSVAASGTIYATGLVRLRFSGQRYTAPEQLSPSVKGSHPAIAPDESFLVFSARRSGGLGSNDLYVVFRQEDGSWGEPRNLGPGVNTESVESSPTLSNDGKILFFSRREDIWWVDAWVIEAVRQ